jgi:hypothetical protein
MTNGGNMRVKRGFRRLSLMLSVGIPITPELRGSSSVTRIIWNPHTLILTFGLTKLMWIYFFLLNSSIEILNFIQAV